MGWIRIGLAVIALLAVAGQSGPARAASDTPAWLSAYVGTGEGQIAPVVLDRARALYLRKLRAGDVRNPCYFAMDATRPSTARNGTPTRRFYVICEGTKTFRATSSGYGSGRTLPRADFRNGRTCARHFSNAEGSNLTMGGNYTTAESRTSFKGYHLQSGQRVPFNRTFLLFDSEGETRNARERAIGGHLATFLRWQCRFKNPSSPHADEDGYVPFGRLVNYTAGRSNGCTTWSDDATPELLALVEGNPTTLYIYPEGKDINAVAKAVKRGQSPASRGLYWNAQCLSEIGTPKFWPKRQLQPIINGWRASLPPSEPYELPICK